MSVHSINTVRTDARKVAECIAADQELHSIIAMTAGPDDDYDLHVSRNLDKFTIVGALLTAAIHMATQETEGG
jgi:hypothetical protein